MQGHETCSPIPSFRVASFTAWTAGFAFSRIPATQVGGTCVVRSAAGSTIAGSVPANGAPRTTERPTGNAKKKRLNARRQGRQAPRPTPSRRLPDPRSASGSAARRAASDALPGTAELRLEGVVLDESSVANSPMLPYVRMVVGLIEGVEFTCREVVHLLRQAMRQHSIGARRRIDYVLGFLHQHPP